MNRCSARLAWLALILWLTAGRSFAHAPFDCSVRVFFRDDSVEINLTVGSDLGAQFLAAAGGQSPALGHPLALNPACATNWFHVSADATELFPRSAGVITDGLEFNFSAQYPLPPAGTIRLEPKFISQLTGNRTAPLVICDDNGSIIGSTILSPEKMAAELLRPEKTVPTPTPISYTQATTNDPPKPTDTTATAYPSFADFLRLGLHHILNVNAADHLLFLAALLLGCRRLKPMLLVITGFTLAHSITLAIAALEIFTLPTRLVEPLIAASIIFVALENFRRAETSWPRYALTCGLGLIHGFGFAGALRESGLGGNGWEMVVPLLAFNCGVELGQLIVALGLLPLLLLLERFAWFRMHGVRFLSALIMLLAAFWVWQRLAGG